MKNYVCKSCGHTWQSASPALECAKFGCGSRLVTETAGAFYIENSPPSFTASGPDGALLGAKICLWVAAAFFILAGLCLFGESAPMFLVLLLVGSMPFMVGFILCLVRMHRAWQVVQPATGLGRGLNIPTPGQAIGFLFIPFYNFYWFFVAYAGLMKAANALREDRHVPTAPFSEGAATFYGVCCILCLVPVLNIIAVVAICFLLVRIISDATRIVNTIR